MLLRYLRVCSQLVLCLASLIGSAKADVIGWYPFDTDGADNSGAGNGGTVAGDVTFPGGGNGLDGGDAAQFGLGGGGHVVIPLDANPHTHSKLTVGMWVKPDASLLGTPGLYKVFGHDDGGWDRAYGLDTRESGVFRWAAFTGGAAPGPTNETGTPVTSDWTFLAATWDALARTVTFHAGEDSVTQTCNPTLSGFDSAAIGNLRPDNFAEPFTGLIDEAFVIDHPLSPSEVQEIRILGPTAIADLIDQTPVRTLEFEYTFDDDVALSGEMQGWTILDGIGGDGAAFVDQPANNVSRHPQLDPHSGANYIGTYEDPGEAGTDLPTGVLESDSWIIAPFTRIEFAVAGGFWPFAGTPAAPALNVTAFTVEREVTPGVWEVIESTMGNTSEGFREGVFDLRHYSGETARMRIYDTATGGWGHINVDTIRVFSVDPSDPDLVASPTALFGDLTDLGANPGPTTQTLTLSNAGATQDLIVADIAVQGGDSERYEPSGAPPLPVPIAPGASLEFDITFTPTPEGGSYSAVLEIASNDGDTPILEVDLSAVVTSDPNMEVVAADPLFGTLTVNEIPSQIVRTVTVRNTGVANPLNIETELSGADAASYSVNAPASVAPGEEAEVEITLSPAGSGGPFAASIEISSDDPDAPAVDIVLDAQLEVVEQATLLAFYAFDEEANPFADSSGNENDIVEARGPGGPVWGADNGFDSTGAYLFGGDGDRLIAPIDISVDPPAELRKMSWGAWVRPDSVTPGLRKVMGHDDGGWDRTLGLDSREGAFRYSSFTGIGRPVVGLPGPANTEDWSFLAATYDEDSENVTVYLDLDASTAGEALLRAGETARWTGNSAQTTFAIGSLRPDVDNEGWSGAIDNVFLYEGILTALQLEDIRNRGPEAIIGISDFRIIDIQRNADLSITLTWTSNPNPGTTYTVLFNDNLSDPIDTWADANDGVPTGGELTTFTTEPFPDIDELPELFLKVKEN